MRQAEAPASRKATVVRRWHLESHGVQRRAPHGAPPGGEPGEALKEKPASACLDAMRRTCPKPERLRAYVGHPGHPGRRGSRQVDSGSNPALYEAVCTSISPSTV